MTPGGGRRRARPNFPEAPPPDGAVPPGLPAAPGRAGYPGPVSPILWSSAWAKRL
jgi:hypothetical protein